LLHGYRATISHTYGDVCKYYPSCSAYAVGAVQQHGALKGIALTAARLARCHPWAEGGVDDVPAHTHFRHGITRHGFVVPAPRGKD
jgi:putative membrane protein insertion efficiency factor